jgi:hypothetical protein
MLYETLLLIGALGLIVQTVFGFSHPGAGPHAVAGHSGAAHGGTAHAGTAHGHTSGHGGTNSATRVASALWPLLSPMTIFSICLGAGVAGLFARSLHERPAATLAIAIAGGIAFYAVIVRPLTGLLFRFASKPAATLAGAIAKEAKAASRFDPEGRGVVRLTVDGQTVRLLARLEAEERDHAASINLGDTLVVTSIDKKANACGVTRL